VAIAASVAVGALTMSAVVMRTSSAAWSATTANNGNTIKAAGLQLTDNDSAASMFVSSTDAPLFPGNSLVKCIKVSSTTNITTPGAIKLYFSSTATVAAPGLDPYLDLKVEMGTSTSAAFPSCTGFTATGTVIDATLSTLASSNATYATGAAAWTPTTGTDSREFRVTATVSGVNAAQNQTAGFDVTWEMQN
jgi:hypothetical protein